MFSFRKFVHKFQKCSGISKSVTNFERLFMFKKMFSCFKNCSQIQKNVFTNFRNVLIFFLYLLFLDSKDVPILKKLFTNLKVITIFKYCSQFQIMFLFSILFLFWSQKLFVLLKFVPIINFLFSKFYKCSGFRQMFRNFKNKSVKKCSRLLFYFLKFENSSELLIFLIVFWYTARLLKEIHNFEGKFRKIQKNLSTFFIGISSYTSTLHI